MIDEWSTKILRNPICLIGTGLEGLGVHMRMLHYQEAVLPGQQLAGREAAWICDLFIFEVKSIPNLSA